jgi:hypothetical protein
MKKLKAQLRIINNCIIMLDLYSNERFMVIADFIDMFILH